MAGRCCGTTCAASWTQAVGTAVQYQSGALCSVTTASAGLQALQGIYAGIGGQRPARRVQYIQAERVSWNYAQRASEGNLCGPKPVPFNPIEVRFIAIS